MGDRKVMERKAKIKDQLLRSMTKRTNICCCCACLLDAFLEACLGELSTPNPAGNEQEPAHILVVQLMKHQGTEVISANNLTGLKK